MEYDVIIIGGGPAGLFAAQALGEEGKKILLLEKNNSAGKKLLLAGAGQCNITQDGDMDDYSNHYGNQYKYIKKALQSFTNSDTVDFFEKRGLPMETLENGKVFPKSRSSRSVLNILLNECVRYKIDIKYNEPVTNVIGNKGLYTIETSRCDYKTNTLIVATGGMSYPKTGSTGDGYKIAESLGHKIIKPAPTLTPVEIINFPFKDLAGISMADLSFVIWRDGKKVKDCVGDILFTHKGLSGPGILNNSRWMEKGDVIHLNFTNENDVGNFEKNFLQDINNNGKGMIKTILRKLELPKRLLDAILDINKIPEETQCGQINKNTRKLIINSLTNFPLTILQMGGYHIAMATAGGIDMKQVNPTTMESRVSSNLYFIGEVLDIDGDTGGYNIQAALSTANLCANAIKRKGEK